MTRLIEKPPDGADYNVDFAAWVERQVALLRVDKFTELDRENLLEELDELGSNLHHELRTRMIVLLAHLLKCRYQPQRKCRSWLSTISEQRDQIALRLERSPSLRRYIERYTDAAYPAAVARASVETRLPKSTFPTALPFSQQEVLDIDFIP